MHYNNALYFISGKVGRSAIDINNRLYLFYYLQNMDLSIVLILCLVMFTLKFCIFFIKM